MNPSRLFILRPVATTLLMVAILLAGHRRLSRAAALGAARGRLPDDPGGDVLSRRQPRRDDVVGHRAARAPVRPDAGPEPDVVDELRRRLGDHAAVQPRALARRRRAGGAGGDQRVGQLPADRPADPADLQQGQSGRHADPDARAHLEDAAAAEARGPRRHAARAEDLAAARRRPGQHQRRPAPGRAHPGQSEGARRLRPLARRRAHRDRQRQRQPGQGQLRRADARLDHRRQRPAEVGRRIPAARSSPTATARRCACRTSPTPSTAPRTSRLAAWANATPAIILNIQRQPGANVIEVVDRVKKLLPQLQASLPAAVDVDAAHRPHRHHPRLGRATCSSSCCSPSRWW